MKSLGESEGTVKFEVSGCGCLPVARGGAYCQSCLDGVACPVDPEMVRACRQWIRWHGRATEKTNERTTSYGHKHRVENWCRANGVPRYIKNGAFIRAAILEGYRVKVEGINALFNMRILGDQ